MPRPRSGGRQGSPIPQSNAERTVHGPTPRTASSFSASATASSSPRARSPISPAANAAPTRINATARIVVTPQARNARIGCRQLLCPWRWPEEPAVQGQRRVEQLVDTPLGRRRGGNADALADNRRDCPVEQRTLRPRPHPRMPACQVRQDWVVELGICAVTPSARAAQTPSRIRCPDPGDEQSISRDLAHGAPDNSVTFPAGPPQRACPPVDAGPTTSRPPHRSCRSRQAEPRKDWQQPGSVFIGFRGVRRSRHHDSSPHFVHEEPFRATLARRSQIIGARDPLAATCRRVGFAWSLGSTNRISGRMKHRSSRQSFPTRRTRHVARSSPSNRARFCSSGRRSSCR